MTTHPKHNTSSLGYFLHFCWNPEAADLTSPFWVIDMMYRILPLALALLLILTILVTYVLLSWASQMEWTFPEKDEDMYLQALVGAY
jgi:hypothetical protein